MAQGTTANIYISAFKVSTDQSLFPNSDILEEKGAMVYEPKQLFYFQPTTSYAQLYIRKSSVSLNIERSFRKLD